MYSDLFEQLGSGRGGRGGAGSDSASEPTPIVSFKAGKVTLQPKEETSKTFSCLPDTTRGEVRLIWNTTSNQLEWTWYNRREAKVEDTFAVTSTNSTWERIPLPDSKIHKDDRIYVWTHDDNKYEMYWMQDADDSHDDELVAQVNEYLTDFTAAAKAAGVEDPASAMETDNATAGASGTGGTNAATNNQSQVDALSSILENLGMPQSTTSSTEEGGAAGGAATGTLTLADLQGAMAGIQQQQGSSGPGPSLGQVVTPEAITALLNDEAVRNRLLEFLPEDQRSNDRLEENLRSPQVQQTLRSLTLALMPDDNGNMDGFYSVLANFQLDPADGQEAMASNNPIQAFLDCVLKSVEKEKAEEAKEGEEGKED